MFIEIFVGGRGVRFFFRVVFVSLFFFEVWIFIIFLGIVFNVEVVGWCMWYFVVLLVLN